MNRRNFLTNCFRAVATAAAMSYAPSVLSAPKLAEEIPEVTWLTLEIGGNKFYTPVYTCMEDMDPRQIARWKDTLAGSFKGGHVVVKNETKGWWG